MRFTAAALAALTVAGCATVRQADLDAWVSVPVVYLESHSLFSTLPVKVTPAPGGGEIRNYMNGADVQNCTATVSAPKNMRFATADETCVTTRVGCNNRFLVRDGKVVEYRPVGQCKTDERVRPEKWGS